MSERLTPEQRAEAADLASVAIRQQITWNEANKLAEWLLKTLDDLEALEKERTEWAGIAGTYAGVTDLLKAERDTLRAQNDQYVETNADLIGQLSNMQADNEALRAQLEQAKKLQDLTLHNEVRWMQQHAALRARCEQLQRYVNCGGAPTGKVCTADPKDAHEIYGGFHADADGNNAICELHVMQRAMARCEQLEAALREDRQGYVNILEMRKLSGEQWGQRDGYGGRYGALTREEIELVIARIDAALAASTPEVAE